MESTIRKYARKILAEHNCDIYTYGGEKTETILSDLKEGYPDGMEFPYVAVANAIAAISRAKPIRRAPYIVRWDIDSCSDSYDVESLEAGKSRAIDTLLEWMGQEQWGWKAIPDYDWEQAKNLFDGFDLTGKQLVDWDYMIYNCGVAVAKYNARTDTYDDVWEPSGEELREIGWVLHEEVNN